MAMFVHLAAESKIPHIRRTGISRLRHAGGAFPGGIFAVPVSPNFYLSHQWLRELKRRNIGPMSGVYFRIPDDEEVWVGHYGSRKRAMSAAKAAALFRDGGDLCGWEVIIARRIEAGEIHRVRRLPQVIGWRYSPGSHGRKPCGCDYCQRGRYGARRLRERYESGQR